MSSSNSSENSPAPSPSVNSITPPSPSINSNSTNSIAPSPSINDTSSGTNSTNSTSLPSSGSSGSGSSTGVGIGIGIAFIVILVILCVWKRRRRRKKRRDKGKNSTGHVSQLQSEGSPSATPSNIDDCPPTAGIWGSTAKPKDDLEGSSQFGPQSFSYKQLRIATKNFSESELLGAGGFGSVYRGTLSDTGTFVAVKCIAENSNQGAKEYKAEVTIISDLRHRNLVRLRGWCHDQGKFLLVYEYMSNGSLDYLLFNDSLCSKLSWERRYSIATGLGSALQYLHEECDHVIIHRDIKSSNVLLDENFNAKLGDFGLSRQVDQGITSHTTTVAGTRGYMAPECLFGYGKATRETDVYAFGAVLLELVCGKRAIDVSLQEYEGMLVDWVWHVHSQGRVMETVDRRLTGRYDNEEARRMLMVGLLCSNPDPKARPKIRRALEALLGSVPLPLVPSSKPTLTFGPPPPMSMSQILGDSSSATTNSTSSSSTNPHSIASMDYSRRSS